MIDVIPSIEQRDHRKYFKQPSAFVMEELRIDYSQQWRSSDLAFFESSIPFFPSDQT